MVWITCGLLWCFYQLSFWRHPFTAEDPLASKWWNATFLQIWWRKTLIHILDGLRSKPFLHITAQTSSFSYERQNISLHQVHRRVSLFLTLQEFTISSGTGRGWVGGCHGNGFRGATEVRRSGSHVQFMDSLSSRHKLLKACAAETRRATDNWSSVYILRLRRSVSQIRIPKAFAFQLLAHCIPRTERS